MRNIYLLLFTQIIYLALMQIVRYHRILDSALKGLKTYEIHVCFTKRARKLFLGAIFVESLKARL